MIFHWRLQFRFGLYQWLMSRIHLQWKLGWVIWVPGIRLANLCDESYEMRLRSPIWSSPDHSSLKYGISVSFVIVVFGVFDCLPWVFGICVSSDPSFYNESISSCPSELLGSLLALMRVVCLFFSHKKLIFYLLSINNFKNGRPNVPLISFRTCLYKAASPNFWTFR